MTTYNIYPAYQRALKAGRRNIRFESLVPAVAPRNPVTVDTGAGFVNMHIR